MKLALDPRANWRIRRPLCRRLQGRSVCGGLGGQARQCGECVSAAAIAGIASQVQDLNRRVGQLDLNNADLHRQLAQAEQVRQTSQDQVALLQRQLGEMATRLKDTQIAKAEVTGRLMPFRLRREHAAEPRSRRTIASGNRSRGCRFPDSISDRMAKSFASKCRATSFLCPGQLIYRRTAIVFSMKWPERCSVRISDSGLSSRRTPMIRSRKSHGGPLIDHRSSASRFSAACPARSPAARQLSVLAMGENHPLASNATPAGKAKNRRIEIVVYPDTIDGG